MRKWQTNFVAAADKSFSNRTVKCLQEQQHAHHERTRDRAGNWHPRELHHLANGKCRPNGTAKYADTWQPANETVMATDSYWQEQPNNVKVIFNLNSLCVDAAVVFLLLLLWLLLFCSTRNGMTADNNTLIHCCTVLCRLLLEVSSRHILFCPRHIKLGDNDTSVASVNWSPQHSNIAILRFATFHHNLTLIIMFYTVCYTIGVLGGHENILINPFFFSITAF